MSLLLNLIGGCDKLFELVFRKKITSLSCFVRTWINLHFRLISPITYLFKVIITFTCWFMYKLLKRGMYHLQTFCTMNLFNQENHLCILKTGVVLVLILVDFQTLFFSSQMFDHLRQLFLLDFQDISESSSPSPP